MFLAESSIQLVPDGTLLIHFVLILIMVIVLNRTLLKPINQILSDREKEIEGRMSEAQGMTLKAEEKRREYQSTMREARAEGYRLLEKERVQALKDKEERVRAVRDELARVVSSNLDATRNEEELVKRDLESQAATLGSLISSRVLGKK